LVLNRLLGRLRLVFALTETSGVVRRYFSLQVFDGAMVGIGLVFGLYISDLHGYDSALRAVVSILIGVAISGYTGAFISERAEQLRRIKSLEQATLREMSKTLVAAAGVHATIIVALVNSLSAVMAILVVSAPYLAASASMAPLEQGLYSSLLVCLALLFLSGTAVGRIAGISALRTALQMVGAGLLAAPLIMIVETIL
jgi:predicted membrane protein (TIGR00267 family)